MNLFLHTQKPAMLCIAMIIFSTAMSQIPLKELKIGDKIPEIPFVKNYNPNHKLNTIAELAGKVVILDFFNSGCLACLKSVPVMDSLQEKFKDQIQIIMVTDNTDKEVQKFFNRLPKLPAFPIIINDSNFYSRLFPHIGDPLHVWIDQKGIVKAITDHYNTTESNIRKLIVQDSIKVFKRASIVDFGIDKTLLGVEKSTLINQVTNYSVFFKPLNEYFDINRLRIYKDSITGNEIGLTAINYPLYALYSLAFSKELFSYPINTRNLVNNNRISVRVKNKLDLKKNTVDSLYDEWKNRNLVSYEMKVAKGDSFYMQLQNDLERFTQFTAKIKWEIRECLVLVISDKQLFNTIKNKGTQSYLLTDSTGLRISGMSLQHSLLPQLAVVFQDLTYPVIDETNFLDPITLKITSDLLDLKNLNQELSWYGLVLKKEYRKIKILEIKDKSK